jgi:hypothetical protein
MANLSWKNAIIKVLDDAAEPLHYAEIAERIAEGELHKPLGANPTATVASTLSVSINKDGAACPFVKLGKGYYELSDQAPTVSNGKSAKPEKEEADCGLINAFGMYWQRSWVHWPSPKLLGQQQIGSEPINFAEQRGVYLLHDRRDVVYVGRIVDQSLAMRLKQHTVDRLNGRWDRFSWFGVYPVDEGGKLLKQLEPRHDVETITATMEALLIEGLEPPQNRKRGDGFRAAEFIQVLDQEIERQQQLKVISQLAAQVK